MTSGSPTPAAGAGSPNARPNTKLHGRAFYESIGSPKYIVAPMVDQSEFAWRMLVRSFLPAEQRQSILAYSPMLHARLFVDSPRYRTSHFEPTTGGDGGDGGNRRGENSDADPPDPDTTGLRPFLDGNPALDRPLFVQFCANDPDALLAAARRVAPYCDAIDLNLGCPQGIARKGHYGAFLQEEPELVARLVRTLHAHLAVPVTAKIRILDTPEATLQYARTVLAAGASILTVHGRRREQKGHLTGLADWAVLRYLRTHLPPDTVLFANGNVLQQADLARCLAATGFDGVMSAEGLLSDPGLFGPAPPPPPPPVPALAPLLASSNGEEAPARENGRPTETNTATAAATVPTGADPASSRPGYWWPTPDPRREYWTSHDGTRGGWRVDAVVRRYLDILHVYGLGAEAPPVRKPLFVPGDPVVAEAPPGDETGAEGDAAAAKLALAGGDDGGKKRKRKRDHNENEPHAAAAAKNKDMFASPNFVAVQAHLFHLLRHAVSRHHDIRDALGHSRKGDMAAYERILAMLEQRVAAALRDPDAEEAELGGKDGDSNDNTTEIVDDPNSSEGAVRRCRRPWWVVQPILRPMPAEALAKGAIQLKKKKMQELEKEKKDQAEAKKVEAA
ncbi:dihydrouridine synthase family [Niveomyces insectorum RCEF 264]|uniref:tRNA-dihydrouridine(16/17) synthase [NAD(P)(+)] n=1 Tax=Niveomyces insectorum RCEF 264 TaxID=1081102 RepID=A0A167RFS6_9HYPO|nr:dihydrouridine synthase family [Niveomyces insectorum RCEF 264]